MIKLIRANQKFFLTGLTLVAMVTFVLNFGNKGGAGGDHTANDHAYGTINGKTVYVSELVEARNELGALRSKFDYSNLPADEEGNPRDPQAAFFRSFIQVANQKPEWYMLLKHEADDANIQFDKAYVGDISATYAKDMTADDEAYPLVFNGTAALLKIEALAERVMSAAKISKPAAESELAQRAQSLSLDLIQYKAADFLALVPPPTTQQLQEQFNKYAAVEAHHPDPTTNPSGFGYRLPMRAKLQYVRLTQDAVTAAVAATQFKFPAPDWEVQARKYYTAHLSDYPTTQPVLLPTTSPATLPTTNAIVKALEAIVPTTRPFAEVHDQVLATIRKPMVDSLTDQVKGYITSTMNADWQAYSVFITSKKPGSEPVGSLGVPYTSPAYFAKLVESVQTKFNVILLPGETPGGLSAEQITALPVIGSDELSSLAMALANGYLDKLAKADPTAPVWLNHPADPTDIRDTAGNTTSTTIFRLSEAQPSEPAPDLASVQSQVDADVRITAAYKLADDKARAVVANLKDHPVTLYLTADPKNPMIHIDRMSVSQPLGDQIKPDLAADTGPFMKKAFDLLSVYDPEQNRNPATTIELPDQNRTFAVELSFVDAGWNGESYFYTVQQVRRQLLLEQQQFLRSNWFDPTAVTKRLNFVPEVKNKNSDSE